MGPPGWALLAAHVAGLVFMPWPPLVLICAQQPALPLMTTLVGLPIETPAVCPGELSSVCVRRPCGPSMTWTVGDKAQPHVLMRTEFSSRSFSQMNPSRDTVA